MRGGPLVILACTVALVAACGGSPSNGADSAEYARGLQAAADQARLSAGVVALTESECAVEQAQQRAEDLVGRSLSHADLTPLMQACEVSFAGENLARSRSSGNEVVDAWLDSSGHRANLLNVEFVAQGLACVPDGENQVCSHVFLGSEAGS